MAESARCPECATLVARSLRGDLLVYSSREFVARLALGARLVWWSIALTLIIVIAAIPVVMIAGPRVAVLMPFAFLILACTMLAGWSLLSSPDPASIGESGGWGVRRILRGALAGAVGLLLIFALSQAVGLPARAGRTPASVATTIGAFAGMAGVLACMVAFFASMVHLRHLATRLPDRKVYQRAGSLLWLGGILMGMFGVVAGLNAVPGAGAPGILGRAAPPLAWGVTLLEIVFFVLYAGLIDRVKTQLVRALRAIDTERETAGGSSAA